MPKKVIAYSIMLMLLFSLSAILANAQFKEGTCESPEGANYCGQKSRISNCYCDNKCTGYKDCCLDFIETCPGLVASASGGGGSGGGGGGSPPQPITCKDSDGGKDYYVKGTANGIYGGGTDFCYASNLDGVADDVQEYYCDYPNQWTSSTSFQCPNGCKDGACIKSCTELSQEECLKYDYCQLVDAGIAPGGGGKQPPPPPIQKCVENPKPTIKVISPNGGEEIFVGSNNFKVEYTVSNPQFSGIAQIKLELLLKDGTLLGNIHSSKLLNFFSDSSYWSFSWQPGLWYGADGSINTAGQDGYKIRATLFDGVKMVSADDSDESFSILTPVCGNGICEKGEEDYCPPCTTQPCPLLTSAAPCYKGTCPGDCQNQLSEEVTCLFYGSTTEQKCAYSSSTNSGGCSGIGKCGTTAYGSKGEKITWKSSCGGYAYTTMDGQFEYVSFNCTQSQTCTDSDGGLNYYVKGFMKEGLNDAGQWDSCNDTNQLVEYYCEQNQGAKTLYNCPNGCQDGACKPKPCLNVHTPACGANGKTYQNSCMAESAGVKIACQKACPCKKEITKQDVIDYIKNGEFGAKITKQEAINWVDTNCYQSTTTTDSITGAVINKAPIIIP
ncbi:hypothetical protein HYW20_07845 [Candidatus Woesearchaeota archaeon]|nr:hypothetical protein [Candidatus Woesearchaeota archaeon]